MLIDNKNGTASDNITGRVVKTTPLTASGRLTNPLYAEIDRLRAIVGLVPELKKPEPIFQTDPEKLYAWLTEIYRVIDAFPEFTEANLYETERAIVDCRELKKRCSEAFDEYGLEWMLELEINFGGGSTE